MTRSVTASAPTNADIRAVSPRSSDAPCCKTDGTTFMPKGIPPAAAPPPPYMMPGDEEQKVGEEKEGEQGAGAAQGTQPQRRDRQQRRAAVKKRAAAREALPPTLCGPVTKKLWINFVRAQVHAGD